MKDPARSLPRGELLRAHALADAHRVLVALLSLGWSGQALEAEAVVSHVRVRIVCSSISNLRRTKVDDALVVLGGDSTLSVQEIADAVGCTSRNLYRSKRFMAAHLAASVREPRRGFRSDGEIDAAG